MKLAAQYLIYSDIEYLELSLASICDNTDYIAFLLNSKPWNGESKEEDRAKCLSFLQELVKKYPKCEIVEGTWNREYEQRNFGLKKAIENQCDWCVIIDTDEAYDINEFANFKNIMAQNPTVAAFHASMATYWKTEPMCQVEPREGFNPAIAVNCRQYYFSDKRSGLTMDQYGVPHASYQYAYLPPHSIIMHHFSYARTDEFVKNKLASFEHSHEILPDWYEKVWLGFKPGDRNFHPCSASQYSSAVEVNMNMLPKNIKTFLQEKFKK